MYILVDRQGGVSLVEPEEFRSFKIVAEAAGGLRAALDGIAAIDPDGKTAAVSLEALRRLRGNEPPAEWIAAFDRMIDSVKRFGWVDESAGTVRAHIEYPPAAAADARS